MVLTFVPHKVRDFRAWHRAHDAFYEERKRLRVRLHAVFRAVSDPNDATV